MPDQSSPWLQREHTVQCHERRLRRPIGSGKCCRSASARVALHRPDALHASLISPASQTGSHYAARPQHTGACGRRRSTHVDSHIGNAIACHRHHDSAAAASHRCAPCLAAQLLPRHQMRRTSSTVQARRHPQGRHPRGQRPRGAEAEAEADAAAVVSPPAGAAPPHHRPMSAHSAE